MDCKEFRHMVTGDPSTAEGEAHLAQCADCREFVAGVNALDATLERAMQVSVPPLSMPKLPEIDNSNVTQLAPRLSRPVWLATAAALVLAVFLGGRTLLVPTEYASLEDEIIAHMAHEPYALQVSDQAVSESRLKRVVPQTVANLSSETGLITYAQSCNINGHSVPHLVIQGVNGPVTVILMPNETIDGASTLEGNGFKGVLLPVGSGSIAIIGEEDPEALERIEQSLKNSVSWST